MSKDKDSAGADLVATAKAESLKERLEIKPVGPQRFKVGIVDAQGKWYGGPAPETIEAASEDDAKGAYEKKHFPLGHCTFRTELIG